MRDLHNVLSDLLLMIPEVKSTQLGFDIQILKKDILFTAPESMWMKWQEANLIITQDIKRKFNQYDWYPKLLAYYLNQDEVDVIRNLKEVMGYGSNKIASR